MQTAQLHDLSIAQQRLEIVVPCMLHGAYFEHFGTKLLCNLKLLPKMFIGFCHSPCLKSYSNTFKKYSEKRKLAYQRM